MFQDWALKTFLISSNSDAEGIHLIDLLSGLDQHSPIRRLGTQQHRRRMASRAQIDQQMMMCTAENTEVDPISHAAGSKEVTSHKSAALRQAHSARFPRQLAAEWKISLSGADLTELVNQIINTKKLNHSSTLRHHISIIMFHTEKCSIRQQKPLGLHLVNFLDNPEDL